MYTKSIADEQELSDTVGEFPVIVVSANEDFPPAQALASGVPAPGGPKDYGWSAFETWHSRIRLPPGVNGRFLRELS